MLDPKVEAEDFDDLIARFHSVVDYLHSIGIDRRNVRIQAYGDFLDALAKDVQPVEPEEAMRLWREVHEMTWVLTVFQKSNATPPVELLRRSFTGPPLETYGGDAGRNFFLELRAAIYFLRAGYTVTLGEDCDVIAMRKKRRVFVECKRLYSEGKTRERIKKCYRQLKTRLESADGGYRNYGVAWIDPSAAMQKHYFVYTAYSDAGARDAARADLVAFWDKWIARAYAGSEKRIFAMVLQMVWPSWIAGAQGIRTGFTSYVVPSHSKIGFWGMIRARRLLDELFAAEGA